MVRRSPRFPRVPRRAAVGFLAVTVAFAAACTSPTLPLPPPSLPSVTAGSTAGHVKLTSIRGAEPNAVLVFYNHNPSLSPDERVDGTLADGEGSWSAEIRADSGDQIDVTQESENGKSPPTTVKIP